MLNIGGCMKNRKIVYGIILAFIIVALGVFLLFYLPMSDKGVISASMSSGSKAMLAECADESFLTKEADYIIEGTVINVGTAKSDEGQIYTYNDIKIEKYIKGGPLKENILRLKTPGGCIGDTCMSAEDTPEFEKGVPVRIYLKQIENELSVFCGVDGVKDLREVVRKESPQGIS